MYQLLHNPAGPPSIHSGRLSSTYFKWYICSVNISLIHTHSFSFQVLAHTYQQQQTSRNAHVESFPAWKRCKIITIATTRWRGGATRKAFGLAISTSQVQILHEATLSNNLRQVVYTYVPLSPSSITWCRPNGGDALRLGR